MVTFNYEEDNKSKVVIQKININSIPLPIVKKLIDEDYKTGDSVDSTLLIDIFESNNQMAIDTAMQYYDRKMSIGKLMPFIERGAEKGNSYLAFYLFKLFSEQSKSFDKEKAIHFCILAAENKHSLACSLLADYYKNGKFVEQDLSKAAHYYELSGKDLAAEDDFLVAEAAEKENRVQTALRYYTLAINKNYGKAYFPLAELYYKHYFTNDNYKIIYNYYVKALQFEPDNKKVQGMLYYLNGFFYLNNIDIVCLKDNNEAINHLRYAISLGIKDAEILFNEYLSAREVYLSGYKYFSEYNYELAVEYFEKTSKIVHDAKYMLGYCYDQGLGVEQNYTIAKELFSGLINHSEALYMLGRYFEYGCGVEIDINKAEALYEKSYNCGKKEAAYALAEMLYKLYGFESFINDDAESIVKKQKIIDWYNRGPESLGKSKLNFIYVQIYEKSKKGEISSEEIKNQLPINDDLEAFLVLKQAVEFGNKDAYELLALYYENDNSDCDNSIVNSELAIKYYKLAGEYNSNNYSEKIEEITKHLDYLKNPTSKKRAFVYSWLILQFIAFINKILRYFFDSQVLSYILLGISIIIIVSVNYSWHKMRKDYREYKEKYSQLEEEK